MADLPVLIAGGGIGGLSVALTLQQIGVPCLVLEAVAELKPLGVGINLQPNAVRELYELGIGPDQLDAIGLQAREWALVGLNGKDVYSEPRGLLAGYRWPQYAVHRGRLQMLLYRTALERLGSGRGAARGTASWVIATMPMASRRCSTLRAERNGDSREAADRRRRPALGRASADASEAAADPLGRRHHVARHDARSSDSQRRVIRRPRHASPSRRVLSDLAARSGDRARHDQLDRRDHASTTREAYATATGTRRSLSTRSSITSKAGGTTGSTCRRCCAAPTKCSNIR